MPEMDFDDCLAIIEHAAREEHKAPNAKSADDPAPCVAALREAWDAQKRERAEWGACRDVNFPLRATAGSGCNSYIPRQSCRTCKRWTGLPVTATLGTEKEE